MHLGDLAEETEVPLAHQILLEQAQCRLVPLHRFGTPFVGSVFVQIPLDDQLDRQSGMLDLASGMLDLASVLLLNLQTRCTWKGYRLIRIAALLVARLLGGDAACSASAHVLRRRQMLPWWRIFRQPMNKKRLREQINHLDVLICHLLSLIRPHWICCKHSSLDHLLWPWLLHQSEQTCADLAQASLQRVLVRGVIAPGEQALHLLEEVVPTPFRMGKYQDKKPLPLSFEWISARPGPVQHARRQFASEMPLRYRSRHPLLGKKRSLLTALNTKMQNGCDWSIVHERRSIDSTTPQCLLHLL